MSDAHPLGPPPALDSLEQVAVFVDFDGTLVPIAEEPGAIEVPSDLGPRLEALSHSLNGRLAVVSGRSLSDLARYLGDPHLFRAGSHGADVIGPDGGVLRAARPIPPDIKQQMRQYAEAGGLYFEDKPHGAGLHSRKAPEKFEDMVAYGRETAERAGLACKVGKQVVELVHPGTGKDGAVRAFLELEAFANALPVFLGDDITDEDGFAACEAAGGFGIAVGTRPSAAARYRLAGVKEVYEWLKL